jgi:two-component system, HptB-dependent secretion and biofilm response regulator
MPATVAPADLRCHVLVVDDMATNRQILAVFLKKMGHIVDLAVDGADAVAKFAAQPYDLVIMDVMMPVMDGYEATRRIKAMSGERWVPVIFLSALDKDENLVTGLDAGGDDYLPKPVNFVILEAKLRSLMRALMLRRELDATRRNLQSYHDEREAENALAVAILEQIMQRPGLSDPRLRYWISSASSFSGDILAATIAINGRFYVLLADATGHGLAAAISVLPLLTQFYDSAGAGVPLERIIYRINTQLCAALPVGRFIAATFACLDPQGQSSELWLGGMPAVLVVDPEGTILHSFDANNLPLGVDPFEQDNVATIPLQCKYPSGSQLVLYSDGLVEAQNVTGEPFGIERLATALASAPGATRLDAVKDAVNQHLGTQQAHDDISLLLIDLPPCAAGN